MKDKNLKGYLQQSLGEEVQPKRLEETIKLCTEIVREQEVTRAEPRTASQTELGRLKWELSKQKMLYTNFSAEMRKAMLSLLRRHSIM